MIRVSMFTVCIFFGINLLFSCGTKVEIANGFEIKTETKKRIKVVGVAQEAKAGAIVVTDLDSIYYVGNLKDWKKKFLNNRVEVSGRLVVVTYTKLDSTKIVQEIRRKPWIKRPIYKLVK